MKKRKVLAIVLITASLIFPGTILGEAWKLHKTKNSIQSFTRKVKGSPFYECMGVTVLNAKIELVAEIIRDIETYPRWFANCKEIRMLKKLSPDNMFIYFVYDAPWPVKDRDVVVKTRASRFWEQGYALIYVEPHLTYNYPVSDKYVRISRIKIFFKLEYLAREKTKVTLIFKVDPAGHVPATLANFVTKAHPYKTLTGMKKLLKDPRYVKLGEKSTDRPAVIKFLSKKERVNGKWVIINNN